MSNYTQTTFFAPKDLLASGNPAKLIKGADVDPELANIATAIATKYDSTLIASAPIGFEAGSAPLPAIYFGASTTSGFYLSATNTIGISTAATARLTINATGNLVLNAPSTGVGAVFTAVSGAASAVVQLSASLQADSPYLWFNRPTAGNDALIGTEGTGGGHLVTGSNAGDLVLHGINGQILFCAGSTANAAAKITTGNVLQVVDDSGTSYFRAGYLDLPVNAITNANYTAALSDRGKMIQELGTGGNTLTIPANASIAFPIGSVLTFQNGSSTNISIAITSDTLVLAGTSTTGTRTLASNGIATAVKNANTQWIISGAGLT